MSFLYESRTYSSEKNGLIRCIRILGRRYVRVDGIDQTSPCVNAIWKKALRRIPKNSGVKKVLILGFGAGGNIKLIHNRFPGAKIMAVEWDPVMVDIAKELKFFKVNNQPLLIIEDVSKAVPRLNELKKQFDLLIVDLFRGAKPAPALYEKQFIASLAGIMAPNGCLLINAFKNPEIFEVFDEYLSRMSSWRFNINRLALYRHRGKGKTGDPLPPGYLHYKQSAIYLSHSRALNYKTDLVGENSCLGVRWHFGPIYFESYESDKEPKVSPHKSLRLIIWQPLTRLEKPAGWRRSWIQMNLRQTGFAEINPVRNSRGMFRSSWELPQVVTRAAERQGIISNGIKNPDRYWENWTAHAKRHRQKWLGDKRFVISEINLKDFLTAYRKVRGLPFFMKRDYVRLIQKQKTAYGDLAHLFAAREKEKGEVIAGLMVIDLPDIKSSHHFASFILPGARKTSVGTGLIDYWFKHAVKNSLRFLNFGTIRAPGDPRSWKGFSRFKTQFGLYLIRRPYPLIKFVRGVK